MCYSDFNVTIDLSGNSTIGPSFVFEVLLKGVAFILIDIYL